MVVEMLSFTVDPRDFDEWAEVDRRTWTAFLEAQPGFVRKEVWRGTGSDVRVVVWWRSQDDWEAITEQHIDEINDQMGVWFRPSSLESFAVS